MADDLEPKLRSIGGEGPSPDFVAKLREQVETELVELAYDDLVVDFSPRSQNKKPRMPKTRRMLAGVAAASIVLAAGFVAVNRGGDEPEEEVVVLEDRAIFVSNAAQLVKEFAPLGADTYRVDTVGTPFSFTTDEPLFVQPNSIAQFVLTHQSSLGPGDQDIVIMPLTVLSDPAQPGLWPTDRTGGWPADDFGGWLDNLVDGITVSNREETTLGGLPALRADLEIDPSACGEDPEFCVGFGTTALANSKVLNDGDLYRIWVVDQGDEFPLAVIVGVRNEADRAWFDIADQILSTLAFGEVAPSPILHLPAGPAGLPFLGGIQIELPAEATIVQEFGGFGRIFFENQSADTEFITNPLDLEGAALETVEEFLVALNETATDVTEVESSEIAGIEARVFETKPRSGQVALKRYPEDERGWRSSSLAQIWLIEHPDRGLLMITAEAFQGDDTVFELIVTHTEGIIGSLEFT